MRVVPVGNPEPTKSKRVSGKMKKPGKAMFGDRIKRAAPHECVGIR